MTIKHTTLLVDRKRVKKNIKMMGEKASHYGLAFRPHFKTHQSRTIGRWFRKEGVTGITVSSIKMAQYFADDGWDDITIAIPPNILAVDELNILAQKVRLTTLVDNQETVRWLTSGVPAGINILIEIDAGSQRTGIPVKDLDSVSKIIDDTSKAPNLNFKGFYSHFGHTYSCNDRGEIIKVFDKSRDAINELREILDQSKSELHVGDTPGCSLSEDFSGITALTAGNFVFYDLMQQNIGSCSHDQIGIVMACPVISKSSLRKEIIVHGGAVHFSKDNVNTNGQPNFGGLVQLNNDGIGSPIKGAHLSALSQEHGRVRVSDELYAQISIGDVLGILPIHSCLTADCMGGYVDFEGNSIDHL